MKIDDLRKSSNIEDRRGQSSSSFGSGFSGGGGNNGLLMMILRMLFMRGNLATKLIAIVGILVVGAGGLTGLFDGVTTSNFQPSSSVQTQQNTDVTDADAEFVSKIFASTEDFWTMTFEAEGLTYESPTLVLYDNVTSTAGCGTGEASAGPFYCSADHKVYLDLSFYQDLSSKYGATGDFAMAYVIAHEVGHHVQNQLGTMSWYSKQISGLSSTEKNKLNVKLELQADYYAGAWAHYVEDLGLLEAGDFEEAMQAAHAVGDDTLQEAAYGKTVPDSFTHGTSEQRQTWFERGYKYGDIEHGDTFNATNL